MIRKERLISTLLAIMLMLSMVLDTVSCIPMHLHTHHAADTETGTTDGTEGEENTGETDDAGNGNVWVPIEENIAEGLSSEAKAKIISDLQEYFETKTINGVLCVKVHNGEELVVNEEHFYYVDEETGEKHVKGANNTVGTAAEIYEGGVVYKDGKFSTHEVGTEHTWSNWERNTDTHIKHCTVCGRIESYPHNYPTVQIGVVNVNNTYYIKTGGTYVDGEYQGGSYISLKNGQKQDDTSGALTLKDLRADGVIVYDFTRVRVNEADYGGYGLFGLQASVYLKLDGEVLADDYYHYQSCLDCNQVRKIGHTAEESGAYDREATSGWGALAEAFGVGASGNFCMGCLHGESVTPSNFWEIFDQDFQNRVQEQEKINEIIASNGKYKDNQSQCTDHLWKLKTYDGNTHIEECYYCLLTREGSHNWVKQTDDGKGNITSTCSLGCIAYLEGEHFEITLCSGEHKIKDVGAKDANCTEDGYSAHIMCENCDYTLNKDIYPATGHTMEAVSAKAPTCTEVGWNEHTACSKCGYTEGKTETPATGHNESLVVTPPTCTEEGYTTHTCLTCGYTYTDTTVSAKGHSYELTETPPTCTDIGHKVYTCTTCGHTYTEEIPADVHKYNSGEITKKPTCTEPGVTTFTCTVCGHTYTEAIEATGHTAVVDAAKTPTCTETGLTEGSHCSVCGEVIVAQTEVAATGHSYNSVVTAPTCDKAGYTTHTCSNCGDSYTDSEVAATGEHAYGNVAYTWSDDYKSCTATGTCSVCGEQTTIDAIKIDVVTPVYSSCTQEGSTEYTAKFDEDWAADNKRVINTDKTAHTQGSSVTENVIAATCTKDGSYDIVYYCTAENCGAEINRITVSVTATGHTTVVDAAVAPTCTETGLTEGSHCSVCDEVLVVQETVDATGHSYNSVVTAPTCTAKGYTTHTCTVCGDTYTSDETPAAGHKAVTDAAVDASCTNAGKTEGSHCSVCGEILVAQETIPAKGHTAVTDAAVAPTCTATGLTEGSHCSVCGRVLTPQTTRPATGHTPGEGKTENNVPATCTTDGSYDTVKYCTDCGVEISRTTTKVDKLGHSFANGTEFTFTWNSTYTECTATGACLNENGGLASVTSTAITTATKEPPANDPCNGAGAIIYTATFEGLKDAEGKTVTNSATVATAAAGHTYGAGVVTPPTCTKQGYTTVTCSNCGATRNDAFTDALGHAWDEGVVTTPAKCTTTGVKTYTCSVCGEKRTESIPATGHTAVTVFGKAATCTETGLTDGKKCSDCDTVLVAQQTIAALGHTWNSGEITTAATCTTTGVMTYTCTVCDTGTKTETIPAAGHSTVTDEAKAPTCTETGLTEGAHCEVCNAVIAAQKTIPATGHSYNSAVTAPTCTAQGYTTYTCSVCNDTYKANYVSATGHKYDNTCDTDCNTCGAEREITHSYNAGVITTAPTCTEKGVRTYTCSVCDNEKTEVIDALGHTPHTEKIKMNVVEATCTTAGSYDNVLFCTVCNAKIESETVTVPALGHTEVVDEAVAPNCENTGLTEGKHCSVCNTVIVAQQTVAALGHVDTNKDHKCDRNCGKTDMGTCSDSNTDKDHVCDYGCGAVLEDCVDTTPKDHKCDICETSMGEHTDSSTDKDHVCDYGCGAVLEECSDKTGDKDHNCDICGADNVTAHTYSDATCDSPATCTECGATTGSELGHSFTNYVSDGNATCTADGTKTAKCDRCDVTDTIADEGSALDHSFTNYVSNNDATCTEDGTKTAKCDRCEATDTIADEGSALDHSFTNYVSDGNATCTADGTKTAKCDRCDVTDTVTDTDSKLGHKDENKDHVCDNGCDVPQGTHEAASGKHTCDYCNETVTTCADGDNDHDCDVCGTKLSNCVDSDKDHNCDICKAKLTDCADNNNDHNCDTCGDKLTDCVDNNKDHACDNGCDKTFGTCADADKDHKCDYGCSKVYGTHADSTTDNDHVCDYGCGAVLEDCSDKTGDGDHKCDICGKADVTDHTYGNATCETLATCTECNATTGSALGHVDANTDHKCDRDCGKTDMGEHADSAIDTDHVCDYGCGAVLEDCVDNNKDHACDNGCDKTFGTCEDKDSDHDCDYGCDATFGEHKDENKDHACDYGCNVAIGTCADADKDHDCDYGCGATFGEHSDGNDNDHLCDYGCGKIADAGCYDGEDNNHNCDECGAENVTAHTYNSVVTAPTCTAQGYTTHTCTVCGDTYTDSYVKENGHSNGGVVVENRVDPTCTETGSYENVVYCTVCNHRTKLETVTVPAAGHSYGEWKVTTAATCTEDGSKRKDCENCDHFVTQVITATGHTEVADAAVAPTCTTTGLTAGSHCSVCGTSIIVQTEVPALGHTHGAPVEENRVEPTCTTAGSYDKVVYCTVENCKAQISREVVEIPSINHKWKATTYEWNADHTACTATRVCENDASHVETVNATITSAVKTPATCTEKGTTTYTATFGASWTETKTKDVVDIAATGHDYVGVVTTAPTCTEKGVKTYTCQHDSSHKYTEEVAALGHDKVVHEAQAPTCTEIGWDAYETCSRCDYTTYEEIQKLGHNLVDVDGKAATCTEDGYTAYKDCSRCDCIEGKETISAIAHKNKVHHAKVDATCVATGTIEYWSCPDCSKNFSDEACTTEVVDLTIEIDSTNHVHTTAHQQINATCTEVGYTAGTYCEDCETWISGHEEIPAIAHKNKVHHAKVDATCVATGTIEYWSCPDCRKNFSDEACTTEVANLTIAIDSANHVNTTDHEQTDATCTEVGYTAGTYCEDCDKWISGHEEITKLPHADGEDEDHNCDACGKENIEDHTSGIAVEENKVDSTCTKEGSYDSVVYCTECNAELSRETKTIAKKPHTEETIPAVDATCTATGLTAGTKCSVCDEILVAQQTVPVKAHTPGAAATCTTAQTCTVCGTTLAEKLGHSEVIDAAKAPTCTETGLTEGKHCSVCGTVTVAQTVVPATGHKDADNNHVCDNGCGVSQGTHEAANGKHTCDYCGETVTTCADGDNDHNCDVCGTKLSECADNNNDHNCDICKSELTKCSDIAGDNNHSCDICGKENITEHTYSAWAPTGENQHIHTCTECNATETGACSDEAGDGDHLCDTCDRADVTACSDVITDKDHNCDECDAENVTSHSYSESWSYGDDTHWHECNCGSKADEAAHNHGETVINETHHWTVCECGHTTTAEAHSYTSKVTTEATCTVAGVKTYTCSCGKSYTEVIDPLGHIDEGDDNLCDRCRAPLCGTNDHKWNDGVITTPPTCTEAGVKTYTCSACGDIKTESVDALNHAYGEVTYNWSADGKSCTATRTCQNDASHTETATAEITSKVKTPATCEGKGTTTYTATFEEAWATAQTTDVVDIPAAGHKWNEAWASNETSHWHECDNCDATNGTADHTDASNDGDHVCDICDRADVSSHIYDNACDANCNDCSAERTPADHVYTNNCDADCNVCGATRTPSAHVYDNACDTTCNECEAVREITHDYSESWSKDGSNHWHECSVCGDKKDKTPHSYETEVIAPTCETKGYTIYTCSVCEHKYTGNETSATGHNYSVSYKWNGYGECTATRVCENNAAHRNVCTANISAEVTKEATCTETGIRTYTATFSEAWATTQTSTEVIEKLPHAYDHACDTTCNSCGETRVTAHTYGDWVSNGDKTHTHTCTVVGCGNTETKACSDVTTDKDHNCDECSAAGITEHVYESAVTKAPTCTEAGVKTYTCNCGHSYTESIDMVAHVYENQVAEAEYLATAATCTESAVYYKSCDCGAKGEERFTYGNPLGHEFTNYVSNNDATCTENGTETAKCDRCEVKDTRTDENSALNHIDADDNNVCDRENCKTVLCGSDDHKYTSVVTAPTCTEDGYTTYKCSACGDTYTDDTVTKLGHNYNSVVTAPTCTEKGYTTHTCSRCDDSYVDTYVDAKGHTEVIDAAVAPTCTETGLTEGKHCSVCNEVLVAQTVVDALGHDKVSHEAKAPTCTAIGWDAYETCSRCDYTTYVEKAALDHDYSAEWKTDVEPTCTTVGSKSHHCSRCDSKSDVTEIPALNHDLGEWTETTAPTCTEKGEDRRDCSRCDYYETREVAAKGHTAGVAATCTTAQKCTVCDAVLTAALGHSLVDVDGKAATCTEAGYTAYKDCSRCDYIEGKETIPATDHDYEVTYSWSDDGKSCTAKRVCANDASHVETAEATITSEVTTESTCTAMGTTTYTAAFRVDWATTQTTTRNDVAMKEHSYSSDWKHDETNHWHECSCGAKSDEAEHSDVTSDDNHSCDTCGRENVTSHSYNSVVTAPTCTEDGYTTYTCNCGNTYTANPVDKLGHKDENKDHNCDNGCEVYQGEHTDSSTDKDHVCDYGCKEILEDCSDKTGDGDHKCDICSEADVTDHTYGNATCDAPATCTECNATTGEKLGHDLGEWTETTAPTCTEKGEDRRDCSRCDYYETREVDALGHDYKAVVTAPTCTERGYTTHTCSRCSDSYVDTYVNAINHDWDEGVVTTAPTCTEKGIKTYTCQNDANHTYTEAVDALGHDYDAVVTAPTCTEDGYTTYTCSVCGDTYTDDEVAATGHTEVLDAAVAPDCENTGLTEGKHCSVCGTVTVAQTVVPAKGHTEGEVVVENNVAPDCENAGSYDNVVYCTVCDAELSRETVTVDALGHTEVVDEAVAPDCENTGLTEGKHCSVCGTVTVAQTVVSATGHTEVIDVAKASTCTETGLTEGKHCSVCGTVTVAQTVVDALGHTEVIDAAVAPTCTESGLTEGKHCSACGEVLIAQTVVDALGHDYDAVVTAPTCTAQGYTTYTCSVCGDTYTDDEVAATGHTEVVDAAVAPTCTTTGLTEGKHCSVCNAVLVAQETVAALGHDKVSHEAKAPTCTEKGWDAYETCSRCDYTTYVEKAALGHTAGETVVENNVAPDCENAGSYDNVVYCTVCDAELSRNKVTVNALGHVDADNNNICDRSGCGHILCDDEDHTWNAGEIVVQPTCTTMGQTHYKCTACGAEETRIDVAIDENAHSWNAGVVTTDPGCETEGVMTFTCQHNSEHTRTEAVAATGHNYTSWVMEPTCEFGGYTVHTCSNCYHEYNDTFVDAIGHSYGEVAYTWNSDNTVCTATRVCANNTTHVETAEAVITSAVTTDPTCTENGARTYTATFAEEWAEMQTMVVEIDALGHVYGEVTIENNVLPTCTVSGSYDSVIYCTVCNEELSRAHTTVGKLDHTAGEVVVENRVEATCTADGSYDNVVRCTVCNEILSSQKVTVNAKGHTAGEAVVENNVLPTCTADGSYDKVVYCTECPAELSRDTFVVNMLGHKDENKDHICDNGCSDPQGAHTDGDDHDHFCDYGCGNIADEGCHDIDNDGNHNCDECGAIIEGHTAGEAVKENIIDATCTADGRYESVVYCVECDAEITRDVVVLQHTGHNKGEAVKENIIDATCTAEGSYDSVIYCTVCNEELSRDVVRIPMVAHTEGEAAIENYKAPTCVDDGHYDSVVYCVVCSEKLSSEEITVNSLGHTEGNAVVENYKAATCTAEGTYDSVVYCVVCRVELSRVKVEIPLLNHTPGDVVVENNIDPTCITEGSYDFVIYCTECNAELIRDRYTVNRIGHIWGNPVVENEVLADCENAGSYDNVVYCRACEKEVSRETVIIDAHGHSAGQTVVENIVDPTCTHDGSYDNVIYCTTCDDELSRKTMVVDSYGHKKGVAVKENEVAPDCTHDGRYDSVVYCDTCNEELSRRTVTVDAYGHNAGRKVEENKISPDCENPGSYENVVYCKDCGEELSRQLVVLNPLGHDYNRGECGDCGAEDPDYVEPQPPVEDEDSDKNGWNDFFSGLIEMIVGFLNQFLNAIVSLYRIIADFLVTALNTVFKAILGFFKYLSALFKSIFTA